MNSRTTLARASPATDSKSLKNYPAITVTRFLTHVVGMGYVEKVPNKVISNVVLVYTVWTMLFALVIVGIDFHYVLGDFHAITRYASNFITVVMKLFKFLVFVYNRRKVKEINTFSENTFWMKKYQWGDLSIFNDRNVQTIQSIVLRAIHIDTRAIRMTRFFMKLAGFWTWKDQRDKILMDLLTGYSLVTMVFALGLTGSDLWFCRKNFDQAAYAGSNVMTVLMIVVKLTIFTIRRVAFINLIKFCQKNFWKGNYDSYEENIMRECERRSAFFIGMFIFYFHGTIFGYALQPILESMGKNETDRILPFTIWLDFPSTSTPYYETLFLIETFALYHSSICYACFDTFLCLMNIHIVGQFRMLQRRFELVCCRVDRGGSFDVGEGFKNEKYADLPNGYWDFENCVRRHQTLIHFTEMVEDMYTPVILGQVVLFSLLICLVGYQAVLAEGNLSRRMIFVVHSTGSLTQLFMFTLTCDDLKRESEAVADAAYRARWYGSRSNSLHRIPTKDLMFVITRARRPCCLTAGGFFIVTLETFRAILSTAMSYLTLLRNGQQNAST